MAKAKKGAAKGASTKKQKASTTKAKVVKQIPPISMLLYGKAGTGKSVLANTFPKCLVFDFDNSHKMYKRIFPDNKYISGSITVKGREMSMIELLQGAIEKIKAGKFEYETLVIDSLTNLENAAISMGRGLSEANWNKNLYQLKGRKMTYDDWGNISGSTISLLMELRKYDVNIIVVTQIARKEIDRQEMIYPQLIGKGQDESLHFPDFIGYMTKVEGEKKTERYLHLNSYSGDDFVAKARLVQGDVDPIKNPHYDKIKKLLEKDRKKLNFSD